MDENEQDTGEKKKSKRSVPLMVGAGVGLVVIGVLVSGVAGVNVRSLFGGGEAHGEEGGGEEVEANGPESGPIVDLAPLIVRLDDEEEIHYLKTNISVELRNEATAKQYEARKVIARDAVIMALSSLTISDTRSNENREKLRTRLKEQLGGVLGPESVRAVYFSDFVTQ